MNSAEYPTLVQATATGWKITAFKLDKSGDMDKHTCEGVCYQETLERARKGLMEVRVARSLANMSIFILPTDGIDDISE